jgi:hypothetical protein
MLLLLAIPAVAGIPVAVGKKKNKALLTKCSIH